MTVRFLARFAVRACLCGVLATVVSSAQAAKPTAAKHKADSEPATNVELFEAMKSGDIEVRLIAKDSRGGNVLITNKTKKPLSIKMPEAFAGVPVLAQFGGGGFGGGQQGGGGGGQGGGGQQQGVGGGFGGGGQGGGGGFGGGGQGGGGQGGGGGFFNVGPEKVGKIAVVTVCLEHGKPEPNNRINYEIRPIESFTQKANVIELCKMVGRREIPQNAGQAAAWHMANGLSWEELASKPRIKHIDGSQEMYFVGNELHLANRIVNEAVQRGKDNPIKTNDKQDSQSQK